MKRTLIALLSISSLLLGSCVESPTTPKAESVDPKQVRGVQFLEFHADWCGPCQTQKPIVEALKKDYPNVNFQVIDVDEDAKLAAKYKVDSIPRMFILIDGEVVEEISGLKERDYLARLLDAAIRTASRAKAS